MDRFKTREVTIGKVKIGSKNKIAIQSMTNTDTLDVEKTCQQIMQLQDVGCDIARLTVQGERQAYALEKIKDKLIQKGYDIPVVADIHFLSSVAIIAADFVDKVRINPGNFAPCHENDSDEIALEKIEMAFLPLIEKCKKNKTALRIGVNHGSLSKRILSKYGNTTKGMVVSALEFTTICRKNDFHNFVYSMKSSNPSIMVKAYKELISQMKTLGYDYPLHLGVTEAGDETDGIIKSSTGIGALLLEGIGDTIRFSLTADPAKEILPAKNLIEFCSINAPREKTNYRIDDKNVFDTKAIYKCSIDETSKKWADFDYYIKNNQLININNVNEKLSIISAIEKIPPTPYVLLVTDESIIDFTIFKKLKRSAPKYILAYFTKDKLNNFHLLYDNLTKNNIDIPIIANFSYEEKNTISIEAAAEFGYLLLNDLVSGICIEMTNDSDEKARANIKILNELTLKILQATEKKITRPEYISCPGCGRTLYDIEKVVKDVKKKTSHLKGVKIAVMGCVVNGPGEMAGADFGLVGGKKNMVNLYYRDQCIEKNILIENAADKLLELIQTKI